MAKPLIRNSSQVVQAIDFSGVKNGKIHPSDIDAVLEFDNEVLILIEVKREGNKIPTGQKLLLERLCDNWKTGKSVVLYVTHNFNDVNKDIPLKECKVKSIYYNKNWYDIEAKPLINILNQLGTRWDIKKLNIKT